MNYFSQTIDFTVPVLTGQANFTLPKYAVVCAYDPPTQSWSFGKSGGYFKFNLVLPESQEITLRFELRSGLVNNSSDCPLYLKINGMWVFDQMFNPKVTSNYTVNWRIAKYFFFKGENQIELLQIRGDVPAYIRYATADTLPAPKNEYSWMEALPDDLPVSDINIPGSHDSAAISTTSGSTPYATQGSTITQQLMSGIRLLDVRLKVKLIDGQFEFVTCHGAIGFGIGINEYQSFESLLKEVYLFILKHSSETVLISLKIDDWNNLQIRSREVLYSLMQTLKNILIVPIYSSVDIPTLGDLRGKVFLINRINLDSDIGIPFQVPDNTPGALVAPITGRKYSFYVQDQYSGLPSVNYKNFKTQLVTEAFSHKVTGNVLLNFASATHFGVLGVYIMSNLLRYFGKMSSIQRPKYFGWTLFDYPESQYGLHPYKNINIASFIIDSNFGYKKYPQKFTV